MPPSIRLTNLVAHPDHLLWCRPCHWRTVASTEKFNWLLHVVFFRQLSPLLLHQKWHHRQLCAVHFGAFLSSCAPPNLCNLAHTAQPVKSCWRHESASRFLSTGISTIEQCGSLRISRWQSRRWLHQLEKKVMFFRKLWKSLWDCLISCFDFF